MRTVVFVRHGKAEQGDMADHERKLTDRGRSDAAVMAKRLMELDTVPTLLLSSSAARALETARLLAGALAASPPVEVVESLYGGDVEQYESAAAGAPNEHEVIAVVGHNPATLDTVNRLGTKPIEKLPTCGVVAIRYDVSDWSELSSADGTTVFVDYPKPHR